MLFRHFRVMFCIFWIVCGVGIRVLIKNDEWRKLLSAFFVRVIKKLLPFDNL